MGLCVPSEFSIIEHYFSRKDDVADAALKVGIGDDAAVIKPSLNHTLAISVDTLIAGRHFPLQTSATDIGYKSLAVNLSDMAAIGAKPKWITLSLSIPDDDAEWLKHFAESLFELADEHQVYLIGGDTVKGPLTITIQIIGELPQDQKLLRSGANVGDLIVVSGTLGDAAAGLHQLQRADQQPDDYLLSRLNRPTPRVKIGMMLHEIASSTIDISDGLIADLGHILKRSQVGATIDANKVPLSTQLKQQYMPMQQQQFALSGGDDYELCFTISPDKLEQLAQIADHCFVPMSVIGTITGTPGLIIENQLLPSPAVSGFDHFKADD